LVAGGCGSPAADETSSGAAKSDKPGGSDTKTLRTLTQGGVKPSESDVLVQYYGDDPDTLNALTGNDSVSSAFHRNTYEYLADRKFSDPDEWIPMLAESWEFDKENLTFTIRLRKGVKWHPMSLPNGKLLPETEFTSKDVKFTFDCILNENIEAANVRSYYLDPEEADPAKKYKISVTVIDKYTVKIKWTKPYFLMDEWSLRATHIIPRHVYSIDKNGEPVSFDFRNSKEFAELFNNHWANSKMCGTGPMIFEEWKKEQYAVFVRNPDYWGSPVYFNKILYRMISNTNTALQQILQGGLDWGSIPQKDHYMQSKEHKNVKAGKVKLEEFRYPAYRYMGYNMRRDLFKDKRVRRAISHAVPVDEFIDKLYYGLAQRLTGPFLPGSSGSNETLKPIPFDLEKAKALLDEAGWKDSDEDGVRDKIVAGKKVDAVFDLMIYADSPQYRTMAEIIRENLRRIGVDAKVSPTKWALMLQKLRKKEYDVCILGWVLDWTGDPFQLWHSSQADLPESSNSGGYKNPEADKIIEELRVTLDKERQIELMKKFHQVIYDDQPYTFLFMDKATAGRSSRLENIKFYLPRPAVNKLEWTASRARELGK